MVIFTLWIDNNNVIELRGLTNTVTDAVDTGATVTVTIKDAAGVDVVGQVWPVYMTHDSSGTYRATMDSGLALLDTNTYTAVVDSVGIGGEVAHFECEALARVRGC